eukprot:12311890-Karenia_brevis.AAC.1
MVKELTLTVEAADCNFGVKDFKIKSNKPLRSLLEQAGAAFNIDIYSAELWNEQGNLDLDVPI